MEVKNVSEAEKVKIYCYTSPSGKKYIGLTSKTLSDRAGKDGSNYKPCLSFYRAILKYGFETFTVEILEDNLDYLTALEREKYYIKLYDTTNPEFGYNISIGGDAPFLNRHHTEETKQKISEKLSGENAYWYGKHLSDDTKQKISEKAKVNNASENNPRYGVKLTEETKQKISNTHKKRGISKGTNNPNYGKLGNKNALSVHIYCIMNGERKDFIGIREAARQLNIPSPNIVRALSNPGRWSAGKDSEGNRIYWFYANSEVET